MGAGAEDNDNGVKAMTSHLGQKTPLLVGALSLGVEVSKGKPLLVAAPFSCRGVLGGLRLSSVHHIQLQGHNELPQSKWF